ncbi:hypothetical protein C8R43DRAFT_1117842 [Mycena crocata]|nr:hypothetical protein C8R43DRAFT_1117842 [Mycena crocata]
MAIPPHHLVPTTHLNATGLNMADVRRGILRELPAQGIDFDLKRKLGLYHDRYTDLMYARVKAAVKDYICNGLDLNYRKLRDYSEDFWAGLVEMLNGRFNHVFQGPKVSERVMFSVVFGRYMMKKTFKKIRALEEGGHFFE